MSNHPEIWHRCSFYISSERVRCPKKSVHYANRYSRLKIKKKNFESRFLREYLIDRLEILTNYCTNWMLLVVEISSDYLHLFFRKKLFSKKFAFSLSHDNKSKNYPIVLKFGTEVAFIYLQIEFIIQ